MDGVGADAVRRREVKVCSVGSGLIPALDGGADGTCHDGQEQGPGNAPLVQNLVAEGINLALAESFGAGDVLIAGGILGHQRALADDVAMVL